VKTHAMTPQVMPTAIACRRMDERDLPAAHALSQALRWPYRLEDWQFLLRLGTGFVAEEDGAVIGTGLCWKQGPRHGTLGAVIVSPHHQGQGIGRQLMDRVLQELGERCTLLNATVAGQSLYRSLGFKPIGTIHQHQGTLLAAPPVALADGERIRPVTAHDTARLVSLSNRATGMARDEVLQQLAGMAQGAALERRGELIGFSMLRRFGLGQAIGPVVAPDNERTAALVTHWTAACAGAFVRVDVTGTSGLGERLTAMGLKQVDSVVTMARNGAPATDGGLQQSVVLNQSLF
jgi:ribosomal protein S18 acetylase RimI-like enzyme